MKRVVGRNKKQEGILILPQSVHTNWHLQLLAKDFFFFFFFTFLRTCVRKNKFCFQGKLHGSYLQIKSQLCEHFYQSQESPIPGRLAFYVSALIFRKGLCISLKHNLLYVLPVIKMFHLRLHKWLIPLCSMASVSGKKIL